MISKVTGTRMSLTTAVANRAELQRMSELDLEILRIGPHIIAAPIVHGSGDCSLAVRHLMLAHRFDCLAVALPASFQPLVTEAIGLLPTPTIVVQRTRGASSSQFARHEDSEPEASFVPIDPCQSVIAAIRTAMGERLPIHFVDLETDQFRTEEFISPDPYALKATSLARFAAAILPSMRRPQLEQTRMRVLHMAFELNALQQHYRNVLFVCSMCEWPYVREAYQMLNSSAWPKSAQPVADSVDVPEMHQPTLASLYFLLGEFPFVTSLYEQARVDLSCDENLTIDGIKELLIAARVDYKREYGRRALTISPMRLSTCLRYARNLSLVERRMSPDLYTLITAAQQVVGDGFALSVAETARDYPLAVPLDIPVMEMGVQKCRFADGGVVRLVNRLPGPPVEWRRSTLQRRPPRDDQKRWQVSWDPRSQCSWPPEDKMIENFRTHVADRAKAILGTDLARTEKFTTSVKDGIDIRDTLRNWHTGDIYVKVMPPSRGHLNAVVMLFDSPADPREYRWRSTWYAEHQNESTLAFFATNYRADMVGPGIGLANYGGAMFLFPPLLVPDIWFDPRLDFTETLEERLLAAACLHSPSKHIALLSSLPPGAGWRKLARRFGKKWVHVPLSQFSESTIERLKTVHVLNGKQIRSYASQFIREKH